MEPRIDAATAVADTGSDVARDRRRAEVLDRAHRLAREAERKGLRLRLRLARAL